VTSILRQTNIKFITEFFVVYGSRGRTAFMVPWKAGFVTDKMAKIKMAG
jgi:hypothetical protein